MKTSKYKAIDFFCGGGGMTCGLRQAGINVIAGVDFDQDAKETYEYNNSGSVFIQTNIKNLRSNYFERKFGIQQNDDFLILVGCSPCQFYSIISMNPDMERIIDLHPDAILLSPFENSGGYGRIEKLDIPIIECADYMETSALGRAEWMRFYGLLFGVAPQADNLFAEVDSCYQRLKMRAQLSSTSFSVVSELKSGSAWYVPGGRSTIGRLFQDACGRYAFADDTHSGSVPLAFETVFDKAGDADVWLVKYNRDRDMSYADLEADYIGYTGFKAFKTRNVYGCNTAKVPFYEETPFRPDYLLSDLIQILHPEIGDLGGLRYFCRLKE